MRHWTSFLALAVLVATPVFAQQPTISAPPLFVLPNEGRNPEGQIEGMEGGAFTARGEGVGAVFYNPAGLALSEKSSISASSAAYDWTFYSAEVGQVAETSSRLSSNGRLFGFVLGNPVIRNERLRIGFAILTPVSWKPTLQLSGVLESPTASAATLYSADGSYSDIVPTIAAGYALRPGLRVGGSLGFSFLSLSQEQLAFLQGTSSTASALTQRTFRADGTTYSILLTGGLQWDVSSAVSVGLVVGAPGLRVGGSSSVLVSESTSRGAGYESTSFRDPEAEFEIRHPARVQLGASWRFGRGELEADVKFFAGTSAYEVFSSNVSGLSVVAGPGGSTSEPATFSPTIDERRAIANVALGGRYDVTATTALHLGFFTAFSPVTDQSAFASVDIYGISTGASVKWKKLSGSIGLVYQWGSQKVAVASADGTPGVGGQLDISSIHLLWGLTYSF